MALGFKVADGYVEVHANYNKGELQRAAQQAADDNDRAFNKERERNSRSSATRDTNQRIGREANKDFVRGVRDQANRNKENPFIRVEDVKRDASNLGRVHVREFTRASEQQVDRDRNRFRNLGRRMSARITEGLIGNDGAGKAGSAFFRSFIEVVSFGQADIGGPGLLGPLAKRFAAMGTGIGLAFAGAFVVRAAQAITALLPLALGVGLLIAPIIDLWKRNTEIVKGHVKFLNTEVGQALKRLHDGFGKLGDAMGKAFSPTFLSMLKAAGKWMESVRKPLAGAVKAISPGAAALFTGVLKALSAFGKALAPYMPTINAGLAEWGKQMPGIAKAVGDMFGGILKDPASMKKNVRDLAGLIKDVVADVGDLISGLTTVALKYDAFAKKVDKLENDPKTGKAGFGGIGQGFVDGLNKANAAIEGWINRTRSRFLGWIRNTVSDIGGWGDRVAAKIQAGQAKITNGAKRIVDGVVKWLSQLPGRAVAAVGSFGDRVAAKIQAAQTRITAKARDIVTKVVTFLKSLPGKAAAAVSSLWSRMSGAFTRAVTGGRGKASDLVNRVVSFLKSLPGKAASAVSSLWSRMSGSFSRAISQARSAASRLVSGFIASLRSLPGKAAAVAQQAKSRIIGVFAGAGGWLRSAGANIARGLASGISSGLSWVTSAARRLASAAVSAAKSALHISSPSKVFADEVGKPSAQGIVQGIERNLPKNIPGLAKYPAAAMGGGGGSSSVSNTWNPSLNVNISEGLNPINAAARRALIRELFLELEQYRKDYVR